MSLPEKTVSLRQSINRHCRVCIYDHAVAGTWRQQVTLCSVTGCPLYPVRPVSKYPIPESVLDCYSTAGPERDRYTLKRALNGRFSDQTGNERHQGINGRVKHSTVAS